MNKGMFGFPPVNRSEMFYGFPDKRRAIDMFFGFPHNVEEYDFKCDANVIDFTFTMQFASLAGARVTIDKGDSTVIEDVGTGGVKTLTWTYSQIKEYNITFSGDIDKITRISINGQRLKGELKQNFIDKLTGLTYFLISNNNQLIGELPSFNNCSNLYYFACSSCNFSGTLPSFAACTGLIYFYCNYNQFSGTLPNFGTCTALAYFYCNNNQFSGTLPSFAACTGLIVFYCNNNQFSGTLPSFAGCTGLIYFYCHYNQFSGTLPNFETCTGLIVFYCNNNQFSGTLPSFAGCTGLQQFNCQSNLFTGELPSFISCIELYYFSIANNSFTGIIPVLTKTNTLISINISNNLFDVTDYLFNNEASVTTMFMHNADIKGTLTLPQNSTITTFYIHNNEYLNNIIWNDCIITYVEGSSNVQFYAINCNLNIIFPFGTTLLTYNYLLYNNSMSIASIDGSFENLFTYRNNFNNGISKSISAGGTNAIPTGTYQQPSGFTHDLTEGEITTLGTGWTIKEKIWILVNCQISSTDTTKRYRWTITTN